ncbi:MAG: hypothetical protein JNK10_15635, partial [Cyclobacteriaceae bacterium]|nr:hypothetical protein [Cyclobacteriaceae bacterium]
SGANKRKQSEISFQQSLSISEIASLPTFQDKYGNGFQQLYGQFFSNWGANYREIDSIGHPYQWNGDPVRNNAFAKDFMFKRIPYRYSLDL